MKDALPLLKKAIHLAQTGTKKQNKEFMDNLSAGFEKAGKELVARALKEGFLTKQEWASLQKKGFKYGDMSNPLGAYFNKKDKNFTETMVCLTTPDSPVYKNKEYIEKKCGVLVKNIKELNSLLEKESKKETEYIG